MSWREELVAYLRREAQPSSKYSHQPRLYALAHEIAQREALAYDDDVVFAAAYLHDLGVFIGHRPEDPAALVRWDHVAYVRDKAPCLLREFGFPAEKIPAVIAAIEQHQPQDEPTSSEAVLLRDADILEQLGAVGVMRTVAKLGSDTRFHVFADVQRSLEKSLASLPEKIRLETTKSFAAPRLWAMRDFLDSLEAEAAEHND
ncbi:HD domain-containing protein [Granulicella cerasi]|uniref:HD domain-containing protein n=1 Tax=Granulicella cerasi TaxID=741063 RepID=A0ABW1Z6W6_9BACT|nr:HD domain-containing protein [Granulicella cerasi]